MKRILQIIMICILFIPLLVNAETCDNDKITISSIELENKSNNVEELDNATSSYNNININLNMSNVGDNIKYKIVIKNDSNKDYYLNKKSIKTSSNYIDYNVESGDNSNIVKAKTAKAFYLNILYKKQVPADTFENGSFNDEITMKVNLSSDNIRNPNTGIKYYLIIAFIIIIMIVTAISLKNKRKNNRFEFLIIGLALFLPIGVKALCSVDININSKIIIDKPIVCGSFENDSWSDISYNVKNGNDACYHVGDTKEVELNGLGTHTVRIANKSTPDECSNSDFSQTACGFVIEFADIISLTSMNSTGTNVGGWPASGMRTYLNSDIYNALPDNLKDLIVETTVVSGHGSTSGETNFSSIDKLYLLSTHEVWKDDDENPSSGIDYADTAYNNTRQLDYYELLNVTLSNYSEEKKQYNGSNYYWWFRSAFSNSMSNFVLVFWDGNFGNSYASNSNGVSPAFRIG